MPRVDPNQGLMPSLLDRLIDPDAEGTVGRHGYDLQQVIDAVRRDLEDLLNTHPSYTDIPEEWAELRSSVLLFGLPDLVSVTVRSHSDREEICRIVESIIQRFEPRLRNVRAVLRDSPEGQERHVRFHIEGQLNVDPAPEVSFETVLELTTGHASIQAREAS
jgi:type VI secretion system protein ImpF